MARNFRDSRPAKQVVEWATLAASNLSLTGDGTFIGGQIFTPGTRITIRRIRGAVDLFLEGTLAAGDAVRIGLGLIIMGTDAAVDIASGAAPDPLGDANFSWLWWNEIFLHMPGASTSSTWDQPGGFGPAARHVEVDTKAMRQMRIGESLVWVAQYADGTGTPPVDVRFGIQRVLIGLH